jgi:type I restriction enzyme S subunit
MLSFAGTNISNLSQDILGEIRFPHFDYVEQQRIAAVLASIDAKIECNNRINAELEALTTTLYNYWFVQFDFPNNHGNPYRSSGGKMEYNAILKRKIPVGWADTTLNEITLVSNESITPSEYPNKIFKHFSIPVFDATHTYSTERGLSIGSNKFTVRGSDLLVSKLNPWFSRVVYVQEEEGQICSTEFIVWRCSNKFLKNYLFLIATSQPFVAFCTQSATGTSNSHKRINPDVMMSYHVPYHSEVAREFGKVIDPFIDKIVANRLENLALAQLRDWLLPMLMNGQVTVA